MAVITTKLASGKTTYRVRVRWQGREIWESAGHDKREASRLNARRLREIRAGIYRPPAAQQIVTVGKWLEQWIAAREVRTVANERRLLLHHVQPLEWFLTLPIGDLRPRHMIALVEALEKSPKRNGAGAISRKSATTIYAIVATAIRDARIAELLDVDPCVLPRGTLSRKSRNRREPYTEREVEQILAAPAVAPDRRIFAALALLTGMREGELCGRRWRDWDRAAKPLGCLTVATQYDDRPLKTDDDEGDAHPRAIPVHPVLARALELWWAKGWELVYCRKPTLDDWIVPNVRGVVCHTKSSGYKVWRSALRQAGVTNRSLHSTRHTFISLCRRGGARKDALERITHNASGTIVDQYTHWDWAPLCEVVLCLFRGPSAPSTDLSVEALGTAAGRLLGAMNTDLTR